MEELFGFGLLALILSPEILSFLGIVFVLFALYFLFIEFSLFILLIGLPLISILCYFFYRKHKNKNIDIKQDDKIEGNKSTLLKILSLFSLSLWFVLILSIIISGFYINKNPIIINENVLNKIDLNIKKEKDLPLIKLDYNLNETKIEFSPIGQENKIVVFSQINGNLKGSEKVKTLASHLPLKLIKSNENLTKENIKLETSFNMKIKLAAIPHKRNNGIYLNNIDIISIDFDSNELTNKEKEIIIYDIILPTFQTFINLSLVDKPIYQFNKWYEKIVRFFIDEIIVQNQSIYIKTIFN